MSTLRRRQAKRPDPPPSSGPQRRPPPSRRISAPLLPQSAARQSVVATWTRRSSRKAARSTADGRPEVPAHACCDQPSMGGASAGLECLDGDFGPPCPTPAISRDECTRRTWIGGTTRYLSIQCRRGFGRRRRCARTFSDPFMRHSNHDNSWPLIHLLDCLMVRPGEWQ